jgi:hypothetical protein
MVMNSWRRRFFSARSRAVSFRYFFAMSSLHLRNRIAADEFRADLADDWKPRPAECTA